LKLCFKGSDPLILPLILPEFPVNASGRYER